MGHHQAIIQEHECTQKLNSVSREISSFDIKNVCKVYNEKLICKNA